MNVLGTSLPEWLAFLTLPLLYGAKLWIYFKFMRVSRAAVVYITAALFSLVLIYASSQWGGPDHSYMADLVGAPIMFLSVPTASFLSDQFWRRPKSTVFYVGRTAVEIILIFPVWFALVILFSFWMDWLWI